MAHWGVEEEARTDWTGNRAYLCVFAGTAYYSLATL